MIKRVEFKNKKPELRYDTNARKWIGYQVDVRSGNKRHRPVFRTKGEAEAFVSELRAKRPYARAGIESNGNGKSSPTVSRLFAERLKEINIHAAHTRAERVFREFEGLLDYDLPITAIKRPHFRLYIKKREGDGVTNETINREINELSAALNRAADLFPREIDEFVAQVARPKLKKGKRPQHEITKAEMQALVTTIRTQRKRRELPERVENRDVVALVFELAWLLGIRFGEAERLKHSDYDASGRRLRVTRWKTDSETSFPFLPDRVVEILNEAMSSSNSERIFDITCSRTTVANILEDACDEVGISYGRKTTGGITFHSTRHSFTSRLTRVTDRDTAMFFTGHLDPEMLDHYTHSNDDSKRRAMEAMYGGKDLEARLKEIFDKVRSKKMTFQDFLAALK